MNGSPRIVGNSVEAEFVTTRPVAASLGLNKTGSGKIVSVNKCYSTSAYL